VSDGPSEPVDFQQGSCVLALSFNVVQVPRIPIHRSVSGQGRNKHQNGRAARKLIHSPLEK